MLKILIVCVRTYPVWCLRSPPGVRVVDAVVCGVTTRCTCRIRCSVRGCHQVYESRQLLEPLVGGAVGSRGMRQHDGAPCHTGGRHQCLNGGTCTAHLNDFLCKCADGFSGKNCEIGTTAAPAAWLDNRVVRQRCG